MTESADLLARIAQHLTDHTVEIAQVWADGRVAHVAFELKPEARNRLGVPTGAVVWKVPRSRERRAAEMADAATARFVKGKRPGRVWLWAHNGASLLLTHSDEGWKIVPGSTDAERASDAS